MNRAMRRIVVLSMAALLGGTAMAQEKMKWTGVNFATAAFNSAYNYPTQPEIDYFLDKGMNVFRLAFKWERLQPELGKPFAEKEYSEIDGFIKYATSKGAAVLLDPHNSARYHDKIVGTEGLPNSTLADFWVTIANDYKDNELVWFGLTNEPRDMPSTAHWVETANVSIKAIRDTGAKNLILVPGNAYSGPHSWFGDYYRGANAVEMLKIEDPGNNWALDVHQYLDGNSSGTKPEVVSKEIGVERIKAFTEWCKQHNMRAFLGEFAVSNAMIGDGSEQIGDEAIANMLDYMQANNDVWLGFAWWAAGQRWNEYMFTMQPKHVGTPQVEDRPSLKLVEPYLSGPKKAK